MQSRFVRGLISTKDMSERARRILIACAMAGCGLGIVAGMYAASAATHSDDPSFAGMAITSALAAIGAMCGYAAGLRIALR